MGFYFAGTCHVFWNATKYDYQSEIEIFCLLKEIEFQKL